MTCLQRSIGLSRKERREAGNEFIARALAHELRLREEAAIDAQFAAMADNVAYVALSKRLEDEFGAADWEALRTRES